MRMEEPEGELPLLLSGFRRGMTYGALGGCLVYAGVLLTVAAARQGPLLGLAAGMATAIFGGAVVGGLIGAYLRLLRAPKE